MDLQSSCWAGREVCVGKWCQSWEHKGPLGNSDSPEHDRNVLHPAARYRRPVLMGNASLIYPALTQPSLSVLFLDPVSLL